METKNPVPACPNCHSEKVEAYTMEFCDSKTQTNYPNPVKQGKCLECNYRHDWATFCPKSCFRCGCPEVDKMGDFYRCLDCRYLGSEREMVIDPIRNQTTPVEPVPEKATKTKPKRLPYKGGALGTFRGFNGDKLFPAVYCGCSNRFHTVAYTALAGFELVKAQLTRTELAARFVPKG